MIWNPGDDTDLNEGGADIDTVEVNGGNGAEQFTTTANGTRVRFDRITPAPFSIDIGTSEKLVLNANGGDDTFSATGNLAALIGITVDGGTGNDTAARQQRRRHPARRRRQRLRRRPAGQRHRPARRRRRHVPVGSRRRQRRGRGSGRRRLDAVQRREHRRELRRLRQRRARPVHPQHREHRHGPQRRRVDRRQGPRRRRQPGRQRPLRHRHHERRRRPRRDAAGATTPSPTT